MICVFSSCMDPSIAIKPVFERFQSVIITSGVIWRLLYYLFSHFHSSKAFSLSYWREWKLESWKCHSHPWLGVNRAKWAVSILGEKVTNKYHLFAIFCVQSLSNRIMKWQHTYCRHTTIILLFPLSCAIRLLECNKLSYLFSSLWPESKLYLVFQRWG